MGAPLAPRQQTEEAKSLNRTYKTVVVVFLEGGADSFNMVIPHSNCRRLSEDENAAEGEMEDYDLYADYELLRTPEMALKKAQLLQIEANATEQPCSTFGLHPSLKLLRDLYVKKEAALIANAGALVEPVTKAAYTKWPRTVNLPPSLFAHNIMQRSMRTVHAEDGNAKGVLGKMVQALTKNVSDPMKAALYSTAGYDRMVEGAAAPYMVDHSEGVVRFLGYAGLEKEIKSMSAKIQNSLFAETFLTKFETSLKVRFASLQLFLCETFGKPSYNLCFQSIASNTYSMLTCQQSPVQ